MWLEVENIFTRLARATEDEAAWLADYLSVKEKRFVGRRPREVRVSQLNPVRQTFPSGFVPLVQAAAPKEGFEVQVFDKRAAPVGRAGADLSWLRDYQQAAVDAAISRGRGILKLPTGAGKTELAVALALELPGRWLFLAHRGLLAEQAAERWEKRTGLGAGRVWQGAWDEADGRFVCATFQTLYRRLKGEGGVLLRSVNGIICDEAHTLPSASFSRVAMACPAYWRFGLSGTPFARGDRRSVLAIGVLGPKIYEIKAEALDARGVITMPEICFVPVATRSDKPTYQGVYDEAVVRSTVRNAAVVRAVLRAPKPCLVFVKELAHGRILERLLNQASVRTEFIWGSASTFARTLAIKRLVRGDLDALCVSVIFNEGVDIPELRSVVIAAAGQSAIAAVQRIGRGMRVADGKDAFIAYDFADRTCGCDPRTGHRGCRWMFRHARARMTAMAREGYRVIVE